MDTFVSANDARCCEDVDGEEGKVDKLVLTKEFNRSDPNEVIKAGIQLRVITWVLVRYWKIENDFVIRHSAYVYVYVFFLIFESWIRDNGLS